MTDQRAESPDVSPDVSIVICTYNRRDHVGRTARSAIEDTKATRPDLTIEIIIADNGPEAYGSAVAEEIAQQTGTKVRAVRSSPPNISIARNAGVAASTAPLVAFLDDDLLVDPGWLDGLVTTLQDTGADAVIGPVRPSFLAGSAPDWDPKAEAFTRVFDAADGTRIHVGGPDRTKDFTVSTASSLWHRARCFIDPEPFLPIFGVCGGEDYDLFLRLENRGRRVHWAARGGVRETVPDTRISLGYRFLRGFSGGQVFAAITARNAPNPTRAMAVIMAKALLQSLGRAVLLPIALALGPKPKRYQAVVGLGLAIGKLAWWRTIPLYHMEKRATQWSTAEGQDARGGNGP